MRDEHQFGGYKKLLVWKKSIDCVVSVYELTKRYPKDEVFGLVSQTHRAVVSIASNIAEGQCRATRKDFLNFLRIAYASAAELETQLIIAERLHYVTHEQYSAAHEQVEEVARMLVGLMRSLHQ